MILRQVFILINILFFTSNAYSKLTTRIALINDLNGYVFVKNKPSQNSETIYKLNNWEVFEIDIDYIDLDSTWIKIWIDENRFPQRSESQYIRGYGFIEKSKILLVDSLTAIPNSEVLLSFNIIKADTNKIIDEKLFTYGLEIPLKLSFKIKYLELYSDGKIIRQNPKLYEDLYNVTFQEGNYNSLGERFKTHFKDNTYYIRQECADGAGFYWIVWVVRNGEIIQRLAVDLT
ncbi:MAG: hypothetical protein ACKO7P_06620 [Bacteroidota bacterium]